MTGAIIILFLLLAAASVVVIATRDAPRPARRVAARPLSRRSHQISLARQRRRYQAKLRAMERQQLALIYLLWRQSQRQAVEV